MGLFKCGGGVLGLAHWGTGAAGGGMSGGGKFTIEELVAGVPTLDKTIRGDRNWGGGRGSEEGGRGMLKILGVVMALRG